MEKGNNISVVAGSQEEAKGQQTQSQYGVGTKLYGFMSLFKVSLVR